MFLWLRRIGFVFLSDPLALTGGFFFGGWWLVGEVLIRRWLLNKALALALALAGGWRWLWLGGEAIGCWLLAFGFLLGLWFN